MEANRQAISGKWLSIGRPFSGRAPRLPFRKSILKPYNLDVDAAARLVADLLQRLDGPSLQQAVEFFNAYGCRIIPGATTGKVYRIIWTICNDGEWGCITSET